MSKRRALISCADKKGLGEFAKGLFEMGWEIISTGGTFRSLKQQGISALEVSSVTGFPEILSGRVKTLHPKIHGGILARRDREDDMAELAQNDVKPVDMVVCNLYPFAEAVRSGADLLHLIEEIDIGGPTLLRAAAKNYRWVIAVSNPKRYPQLLEELRERKDIGQDIRQELALEVFAHTAKYDEEITRALRERFEG